MSVVKIMMPTGEVPRVPARKLPDNAATIALNCDFALVELQGRALEQVVSVMPNTIIGEVITHIWTENGADFFAWPWPVEVVRGPVVDDLYKRIYYTGLPSTGTILKVAQQYRKDGSKVINTVRVPNFSPPETSNEVAFGGNGLGPDSWINGSVAMIARYAESEYPLVEVRSREAWPALPGMRMRVTYFIEAADGRILWQGDITNKEAATIDYGGGFSATHAQVFYTNISADRGMKIQDMLWPLGYTPRPWRYYWFNPPPLETLQIGRTVAITNNDADPMSFDYTSTEVDAGQLETSYGTVA